jgi:hypothetical protein
VSGTVIILYRSLHMNSLEEVRKLMILCRLLLFDITKLEFDCKILVKVPIIKCHENVSSKSCVFLYVQSGRHDKGNLYVRNVLRKRLMT